MLRSSRWGGAAVPLGLGLLLASLAWRDQHSQQTIAAGDLRLEYVGRVLRETEHVVMAWPATTLRFSTDGAARVTLTAFSTPRPDTTPQYDEIDVLRDGKRVRRIRLTASARTYLLGTGLSGRHVFAIRKRTEAEIGEVSIVEVGLDAGQLVPPKPRERRIEVLGDSVTAGFGIEGPSGDCPFSAGTENALQTYGALAAETLSADYVAIAESGKGLTVNADSRDPLLAPGLFERTLASRPARWGFKEQPDVFVINLGTNDVFGGYPGDTVFTAAYVSLLNRVRQVYSNAQIVVLLGPMLWDDESMSRSHVRDATAAAIALRARQGDFKIALLEQWVDPAEGVGCQMHPNLRTHRRLAHELALKVRELMSW